jgi:hypothetical protein
MTRSEQYLRFLQSVSIRTRDLRIIKLRFNSAQRLLWNIIGPLLDRRRRVWLIILKARREGVSTLIEGLMLARNSFDDSVNGLVTAHENPATKRIWAMALLMCKTSPLQHVYQKVGYQLRIGRSLLDVATAGSEHASRSGDVTCFHASEVGFWPKPGAYLSTMQAIPEHIDSFCFLESTANGKIGDGYLFYDEWLRAQAGQSEFTPVFLPWYVHATYRIPGMKLEDLDKEERVLQKQFDLDPEQLAWRRWCIRSKCRGQLEMFHQEYPATPEEAFIQSGLPFFGSAELMPLERDIRAGKKGRVDIDGLFHEEPLGSFEIWVPKQPGHRYVIGADSSLGIERADRSRSAAEVLDIDTMEQVAEYEAASAPHVFARHLVGLARYFNDAMIAPEVQSSGGGGGRELIQFFRELNYLNLHRWRHPDFVKFQNGQMYGWETNARTRPRMIARIREVIDEHSARIHSRRLVQQLADFGENQAGRLQALAGRDDLLFAWGIALMSRSENFFPKVPEGPGPPAPDWHDFGMRTVDDLSAVAERHWRKLHQEQVELETDYLKL